jgi:hypothetical protein
MSAALRAGGAYFAVVFAAGFALGVLRAIVIAPQFGQTNAVVMELPVILAVSWFACGWLVRRFGVSAEALPRLVMGAAALGLLLLAELLLSLALGRSAAEHFATYGELPAQLGLVGQVVFALFPLLQAGLASRRE